MQNSRNQQSDHRDFNESRSVIPAAALTALKNGYDGIRQTVRLSIRMLITCLFGLSLQVMAQQPAGSYNVKTDGTAKGDGSTDDSVSIRSALTAAKAAGKEVYFPNGTYIISGNISIPDNTSILGDKTGISLIKAVNAAVVLGALSGGRVENLSIDDMFLLNVALSFKGSTFNNITMRRCVFAGSKVTIVGDWNLCNLSHGTAQKVEDSIFLGGDDLAVSGKFKGISTFKNKQARIFRNIFGLDFGNLSWLQTEWKGYPNWLNIEGRLGQFAQGQGLLQRMGEMTGGLRLNECNGTVVDQNIFHLDFEANAYNTNGGRNSDHIIYATQVTNIEITRNWLSGHPCTAGGGLKHRDTGGPGVIAANYFNDTPLLLYTYEDYRNALDANGNVIEVQYDGYDFENQLIFRNYHKIARFDNLGFGSPRFGINFESDDPGSPWLNRGKNIDIADNYFEVGPQSGDPAGWIVPKINVGNGVTGLDAWRIYRSNVHVGQNRAGNVVALWGRYADVIYEYFTAESEPSAVYLSGMNANRAKYEAMEIPYLNIPAYGTPPVQNNHPPVFSNSPIVATGATANTAYSGSIGSQATDADSNPLTFYKITGPRWLVVAASGALIGNPTLADVGLNTFTVQVSDAITSVSTTLQITVQSAPPSSYTLTYTAGANGSLSGTTPQTVNSGASGTAVTAVADPGHRFINWSDGSTANPRADAMVTADLSVTANFAMISGYTGWLASFPSISDSTPESDSDYDGVLNLLEYALGANPIIRDATTVLPEVQSTPSGAQFTFHRSDTSETDTAMTFQYTDDLSNETAWTDVAIGATSSGPDPNGVEIAVEESDSELDLIRITLPIGFDHRIFGRIRVSVTP